MDTALDAQLLALRERRAFVRPHARIVAIAGSDAERWLNDLVTAGVEGLPVDGSVRALLLSPTGRIRADLYVVREADGFLLVQTADQPEPVDGILAPYVLSSDVRLRNVDRAPVLLPDAGAWRAALEPPAGWTEVDAAAGEAWRIEAAIARFPVDLDSDSLPAEAGLDAPPVTDTGKGCFLGQESVARVRNLGHPTRVVRAFAARAAVLPGERVRAGGADAGVVTSAVPGPGGSTTVIARIRWDAADRALTIGGGAALVPR